MSGGSELKNKFLAVYLAKSNMDECQHVMEQFETINVDDAIECKMVNTNLFIYFAYFFSTKVMNFEEWKKI